MLIRDIAIIFDRRVQNFLDKGKISIYIETTVFLLNLPKIGGFEDPSIKIDGLGQTHQSHAD